MSHVFDLSSAHVDRSAALDPFLATVLGIPGHEGEVTDLSPDGLEARAELVRATLEELRTLPAPVGPDRLAAGVFRERLNVAVDLHERGEDLCALRPIGGPVQQLRSVFDLMPKDNDRDWSHVAQRMMKVPESAAGLIDTLRLGLERGHVAARRQADVCAEQCRVWSGASSPSTSYFAGLADRYEAQSGAPNQALLADLRAGAAAASSAYASIERFLRDEYAPRARTNDAAGAERYAFWARAFLGAEIDLRETYEWGWVELQRIEAAMEVLADRIHALVPRQLR